MKKTTSIDFSEERLLAIASDYIDDHNLIGALKMLNKNAAINGNSAQSLMLYAEAYDDMGLYERCINGWFRYIDYVGEDSDADLTDAYEGIAVSFLNLGQENYAAYYYNKLLMETDEMLTDEDREEIINTFLSTEENHLKIAYPPRLADYSEEFKNGINFMRENDFERAINEFSKVHEQSDKHLTARNYIAMCNIICDKCDEAEQECNAILQKDGGNVQALTTLAAVKRQQNKCEESVALANRLLQINTDNSEDIYKIATVCCENGMHEQAYRLFCRLEEMDLAYDQTLLYFKAIAACNCGKIEQSMECFDKLLTINPDAVTAEYYRCRIKDHRKSYYLNHPLEYYYKMPRAERELNLSFLTSYAGLNKTFARSLMDIMDIGNCVKWCFDENESKNSFELQLLGATCAVMAGLDDIVKNILLDATISDGVKVEILSLLTERNEGKTYGVVVCNLYRRLFIPKITLGKLKNKCFMQAYAILVSRFAMLNADYVFLINAATTKFYASLEEKERLSACRHAPAVAAAIYSLSGIQELGDKNEEICAFFGASVKEYRGLIGK